MDPWRCHLRCQSDVGSAFEDGLGHYTFPGFMGAWLLVVGFGSGHVAPVPAACCGGFPAR